MKVSTDKIKTKSKKRKTKSKIFFEINYALDYSTQNVLRLEKNNSFLLTLYKRSLIYRLRKAYRNLYSFYDVDVF